MSFYRLEMYHCNTYFIVQEMFIWSMISNQLTTYQCVVHWRFLIKYETTVRTTLFRASAMQVPIRVPDHGIVKTFWRKQWLSGFNNNSRPPNLISESELSTANWSSLLFYSKWRANLQIVLISVSKYWSFQDIVFGGFFTDPIGIVCLLHLLSCRDSYFKNIWVT